MALRDLGLLWQIARRVEDVFQKVDDTTLGVEKLRDEVRELAKRVAALEAREELLIEKTRTAAATAASGAVTQHLVDMARRIGALEAGQGGRRRLE